MRTRKVCVRDNENNSTLKMAVALQLSRQVSARAISPNQP